jgi:cellulose synthase/poly-beta-1,6-N-acetylglucosamine synthase-like glycosyltransferase
LVIDNCPSTDATRRLVEDYSRVRYVREDRPGLNIARNRALHEAQGEIVAFTDDDAAPDPNWLRALLRNFADPLVLCATGLTMPLELETEAQEWFQRLGGFGRGFKRMVLDSANCDPFKGWVAGDGVNMAVRRSMLDHIGPFDEALDVGTPTLGGGDTEIFVRMLSAGYRIIYDPEALNWHRHRYTWQELRRQLYGYEVAGFAIWTHYLYQGNVEALRQAWQWFWRELRTLANSLLHLPGSTPLDLVLARFCGAAVGPWSYPYSQWRLHQREK